MTPKKTTTPHSALGTPFAVFVSTPTGKAGTGRMVNELGNITLWWFLSIPKAH
jgi:hypothetical protein